MQLVADLHVHTVASGHAYSTVLENIKAASEKGLKLIALTDHGPAMPGGPHKYYFSNQRAIPNELYGVRILKGVEANVMDRDGTLDLDEYRLSRLDIVLAGLHTYCAPYGTKEENTMMMIHTIENPWVDIIVHPGNPEYEVDEERVVKAAVKNNVAIEINNSSLTVSRKGSYSHCIKIAQYAKEYGAKVVIGTDSHFALSIGVFDKALEIVTEANIPEQNVLNTSVDKIYEYLRRRRNRNL